MSSIDLHKKILCVCVLEREFGWVSVIWEALEVGKEYDLSILYGSFEKYIKGKCHG